MLNFKSFLLLTSVLPVLMLSSSSVIGQPHENPIAASRYPGFEEIDRFVLDLNNGLVRESVLTSRLFSTAEEFWKDMDAGALATAVSWFYGGQGGFVTDGVLETAAFRAPVVVDSNGKFYYSISSTRYLLQRGRYGLTECTPEPIDWSTSDKHLKISANVNCVFANYISNAFAASATNNLDWRFVNQSGVDSEVWSYLASLFDQGLILDFNVDLSMARFSFLMPGSETPIEGAFKLEQANPFKSLEAERIAAERDLNENLITRSLVHQRAGLQSAPLSVNLNQLLKSFGDVAALGPLATPLERREQFLETLGYLYQSRLKKAQHRALGCPPVRNISYPEDELVTPVNNEYAILAGHHTTGGGYLPFADFLDRAGYRGTGIKIINSPSDPNFDPEKLCVMRNPQIFLYDGHGGGRETSLLCNRHIRFQSTDCCKMLKESAISLGLTGGDAIDCSKEAWESRTAKQARVFDATEVLFAEGRKHLDCDYHKNPDDEEPEGCDINIEWEKAYGRSSANNGLASKAILATGQCYGGQACDGLGSSSRVKTALYAGYGSSFAFVTACDLEILAADLAGKSWYCLNKNSTELFEPFDGQACGTATEMLKPPSQESLWGFRSTASALSRGTVLRSLDADLAALLTGDCRSLASAGRETHNADGMRKFVTLSSSGSGDVELYPTVYATYLTNSNGFELDFTSRMQQLEELKLEDVFSVYELTPFFAKKNAPKLRIDAAMHSLTIENAGNYPFMSREEWLQPADSLRGRYGADQTDWSSYAEIDIQNGLRAPNGVRFVGNLQAKTPQWLYPDGSSGANVAPWQIHNGELGAGGNRFTVLIPGAHPTACCQPHVEKKPSGIWQQNGCDCRNGLSESECFTTLCCADEQKKNCIVGKTEEECLALGRVFTRVSGDFHNDAQCCGAGSQNPNWPEVPCDAPNHEEIISSPSCPGDDGKVRSQDWDNYRHLPYDEGEERSCPRRSTYVDCGGGSSSGGSDSSGGSSGSGESSGTSSSTGTGSTSGSAGSGSSCSTDPECSTGLRTSYRNLKCSC